LPTIQHQGLLAQVSRHPGVLELDGREQLAIASVTLLPAEMPANKADKTQAWKDCLGLS
jgi:hypothetical protein